MYRNVLLCFLFGVALGPKAWAATDNKCRPYPECEKGVPTPTPVPPLWYVGQCDRCNGIPMDLRMMQCPLGQVAYCKTSPSWPPLRTCPQVTYGACIDAPTEGTVFPLFQIAFVAYSPPGRGSAVTYAAGSTVGSTTTAVRTWSNSTDLGIGIGANVIVASGMLNVNTNATVTGKGTSQEDVAFQQSQSTRIPGQGDFVNHDYDQIWFWVRPAIHLTVQERPSNSYYPNTEVSWQYEDHQQVTMFWVYAGELLNHIPMPGEVRAQLDAWGITPDYYATLLEADPLVWPTTVETIDANGVPILLMEPAGTMNPARFELIQILPYRPLGSPSEQPTVITYSVQQSQTKSYNSELTQSYSVDAGFSASINFIAQARWRFGNKFTFSISTTAKLSNGTNTTDTLTLGQPSFGYSGPVVVYVYEDKMFHSYAFKLE